MSSKNRKMKRKTKPADPNPIRTHFFFNLTPGEIFVIKALRVPYLRKILMARAEVIKISKRASRIRLNNCIVKVGGAGGLG